MGSTYYYYYELDDGTEHYDVSLPFTTSCPYLPGQPVNLLSVPVEIQPLRFRSASMSSMANGDIKTMNPADKFMTPRAPPRPPQITRLNTSTSILVKQRTARSLSPPPEKPQWSPRTFFGLRSPTAISQDGDKRGRSSSLSKVQPATNTSTPSLALRSDETRKVKSVPHTREESPQSFKKPISREPSPLRQLFSQENSSYSSAPLVIPDEIAEEAEDDMNFASNQNRLSINEKGILTRLSPPPSGLRSPPMSRARAATNTSKPLPQLPEGSFPAPPPLRLRSAVSAAELPRSHFSTSTISTTISSPTDSNFSASETHSLPDSHEEEEEEDLTADIGSGDESPYSPVLSDSPAQGFNGYSLPEDQFATEPRSLKGSPLTQLTQTASRTTFGAAPPFLPNPVPDAENMSTLEQLLSEMGYLSDVIVGK